MGLVKQPLLNIKALPERVKLGVYVNADDIEKALLKRGFLDFDEFKIKAKTEEIEEFIQRQSISIKNGKLVEILERTASTPQWFIKYFYDKRKP